MTKKVHFNPKVSYFIYDREHNIGKHKLLEKKVYKNIEDCKKILFLLPNLCHLGVLERLNKQYL